MGARDVLVGWAVLMAVPALAQEPPGETAVAGPPPGVTLTGRWTLDPDASDDPRRKVREAREGRTDATGPVRVPGGPGGSGTPGDPAPVGTPQDRGGGEAPSGPGVDVMTPGVTGGRSGDPFRRGSARSSGSDSRAAYRFVLDLPEALTIAQRDDLVLIQENDDDARVRGLRPDGVRHVFGGGRSATRTRWEEERLHVKTWREDGADVDEVFEIATDRGRLTVTVTVVEGETSIHLVRVFVPAESRD